MHYRRKLSQYDPSTDSTLEIWLDASDSSTSSLLDTSGNPIANNATIGTWKSKKGTTRSFTQWGSNGRPTWLSSGINGKPAANFSSQGLTSLTTTNFVSISGLTVLMATQKVSGGVMFGTSQIDPNTGQWDIGQYIFDVTNGFGGQRINTDPFASLSGSTISAGTPVLPCGALDIANGKARVYQSGIEKTQYVSFGTAGSTMASEPHAITVGGFAQQSGSSLGVPCNGRLGELLVWTRYLSPDELVLPHTYLRLKWGGGVM